MEFFVVVYFLLVLPFVKSNICPDGGQCPGADPCCPSAQGDMCCPVDGGNCCSDGLACCQPGYTCIPWIDMCILLSDDKTKKAVIPRIKLETPKVSQCPAGTTECAQTPWGEECCPLPNAVCCSDGLHCCPSGYTCDMSSGTCDKSSVHPLQNINLALEKMKMATTPRIQLETSKVRQCPAGTTECAQTPWGEECCPLPNAVCCSDGLHCCPSGYTCDVSSGTCDKSSVHPLQNINLALEKTKMATTPRIQLETSKVRQCPAGTTECAQTPWGEECCPLPNAVCCSDGLHCCPSGYTCDVSSGTCDKSSVHPLQNINLALEKTKMATTPRIQLETSKVRQCPAGTTECAQTPWGEECCPLPNAVCCSDGLHCCPSGYTCDVSSGTCDKSSVHPLQNINLALEKTKMATTPRIQLETSKVRQCPAGTTECAQTPWGEECCPLPNAVCCSDGLHCCPSGYTCDMSSGTCDKSSVHPLQNIKGLEKAALNNVCPDGSQCSGSQTCCPILGGGYGCCIYQYAVCCSDLLHCCPSGFTCNVTASKCDVGQYSIPWQEKMSTIKEKVPLVPFKRN